MSADDAVAGTETASRVPGRSAVGDVGVSLKRWLVKTSRNPFVTFFSLVQPAIFFVLMAEVLGAIADGALAGTVGDVSYVTYLTPAIVIQSALAAAAVSGIGLVSDMESGMFDKMLASPMDRGAMLFGKVLSEVVRITVQTGIILGLGYVLLSLKPDAATTGYLQTGLPGVLGILAVTVLFGGAFMAFSNIVALLSRDQESTVIVANLLTFPLLFVSSAYLPLPVLPDWIRAVAVVNPITYGVDGVRAFMLGRDVMTVVEVSAFGGLWDAVVPAVLALLAFNVALGAVALRLLDSASTADVQ